MKKNKILEEVYLNKMDLGNSYVDDILRLISNTNIRCLYVYKNKMNNFNDFLRIINRTKIVKNLVENNLTIPNEETSLTNLDLSNNDYFIKNSQQIKLLKKNDTIEKRKSQEEKESLTQTIRQLNSNNQNTQLIINQYENKIEQITQKYNNEINNLKEQILSLNKNFTLCVNEKTANENKFKEIMTEMNQKLKNQYDIGKALNMKNLENSKLINELNDYKNNYNEIKLKYSNIELEMDTLKNMKKNYNKLLQELDKAQNDKKENLQKLEISAKIVSELKTKLNQNIEELNNVKEQNEKLMIKNKEKNNDELDNVKKKLEIALKDVDIRNMKIKILEEAKNENKELKSKINAINKEMNDYIKNNEDIKNKYYNIVETNKTLVGNINELILYILNKILFIFLNISLR